MGSRVRCRPIMGGVRATLKSGGVRSLLSVAAERGAARCNSLCEPGLKHKGARYEARVEERGYTAVGLVVAAGARDGEYARIDNWRNNTLKKGTGC